MNCQKAADSFIERIKAYKHPNPVPATERNRVARQINRRAQRGSHGWSDRSPEYVRRDADWTNDNIQRISADVAKRRGKV